VTSAPLVVGVDGSPSSDAALSWAIAEAKLRTAPLKVVCCWTIPGLYLTEAYIAPEPLALENAARSTLDAAMGRVAGAEDPLLAAQRLVLEGSPSRVLLDVSEGASLLVVGARGRGGFIGLLVGSVASQVVNHAVCPVVVVPRPE
jgi:nucleotide-binding universal stress UspA family protein